MIESQLLTLGFFQKETAAYMALHTLGPSPASVIARIANIKRTSIYDILNSLLSKNVIVSFHQGATTYFAIDDIKKVLYYQQEQVSVAKNVVQQLKENNQNRPTMQVNYYRGKAGYEEMYNDILKKNPPEILVWIHLDKFWEVLDPEHEAWWTQERMKRNIGIRILIVDTPLGRKFQTKDDVNAPRETRIIPKNHKFHTTLMLYQGHITYFDSEKNRTGIRVHHPELFRMQKEIFEMNWNMLQ